MKSLFDDLSERLAMDPRLTKRGGPRIDLSVMLFNARDDVRELWAAAEGELEAHSGEETPGTRRLAAAVEALRPIFGERDDATR